MKTIKRTIAEVARDLEGAANILILSHENPDGDAIGSSLGMAMGLREFGKNVVAANATVVPERISWLVGAGEIVTELPSTRGFDTILLLDCAERERTGFDLSGIPEERFISIDHHPNTAGVGRKILIDTQAAATGELVLEILLEMSANIETAIATALYVAIHTDTGGFNYSNTTRMTHMSASILLDRGVDPAEVHRHLFGNERRERVALLGEVLSTLELELGGRVATCVVTKKMLEKTGASPEDSDDFVSYPRSIRGVEVAVLLKEQGDGKYRVSLRANTDVDLSLVAKKLGGGGHKKAAGATISGSMKEATATLLDALTEAMERAAS
ncbi:MAG: bifunctional oligoribonuclease/PAP phosphatase NrnA [Deltaproteobacteria bacterium]|nr:MAG: bifunctional oligoribonuclease/PAP phosphatase NrnA [Deltaproteobacteria bacterium]